jgi:hypothetical protein
VYTKAVSSIPCPRESCTEHKRTGRVCPTTSVFHPERKAEAFIQGLWNLDIALKALEEGKLKGEPLDALNPTFWG